MLESKSKEERKERERERRKKAPFIDRIHDQISALLKNNKERDLDLLHDLFVTYYMILNMIN